MSLCGLEPDSTFSCLCAGNPYMACFVLFSSLLCCFRNIFRVRSTRPAAQLSGHAHGKRRACADNAASFALWGIILVHAPGGFGRCILFSFLGRWGARVQSVTEVRFVGQRKYSGILSFGAMT